MLIEVARDLFANKGKRNVTMNDIAEASKRGRRTLYTYFNNKEEIYRSVLQQELSYLHEQLEKSINPESSPDIQLRDLIVTHLDAIKYLVKRNGSLSADFFHDIYEVERARRQIDTLEIRLIRKILNEGISNKVFKRMEVDLSSVIIFHMIKGLEVPYIRQNLTTEFEENKHRIVEFIFSGIVYDRTN